MKREERARRWARPVSGWKSSGQTQRGYCERESISYASFKRWRLVLNRGRGLPGGALRFIPVRAVASAPAVSQPTPDAKRFGVTIRLRGERGVVIDEGVDEMELGRLIRLLEVLPC